MRATVNLILEGLRTEHLLVGCDGVTIFVEPASTSSSGERFGPPDRGEPKLPIKEPVYASQKERENPKISGGENTVCKSHCAKCDRA